MGQQLLLQNGLEVTTDIRPACRFFEFFNFLMTALVVVCLLLSACGEGSQPAEPKAAAPNFGVPTVSEKGASEAAAFVPASMPTVYRFAKVSNGAYFYTGNVDEIRQILAFYPDFRFEGPAFKHDISGAGQPVYRFANLRNGGYFYTGSVEERDVVIRDYPHMRFEGSTFSAAASANADVQPVYRLANLVNGAYLYTLSTTERDYAVSLGHWRFEGTSFKAPNNPVLPTTPSVSRFECNTPVLGQTVRCYIYGNNLPTSASISLSSCNPSLMSLDSGSTKELLVFSCTAASSGNLTMTTLVPGLLSAFPAVIWIPPAPVVAQTSCGTATVGASLVCTVSGSDLPATLTATSSACGFLPVAGTFTSSSVQFSCTPGVAGNFDVFFIVPGAVGGATRSVNITISPPVTPVVTISNLTCSPATLGQAFTCTLDGANLPSTTSASSGNCSISPLEKASSSGSQIQFRCTPVVPGVFSIDFNVPGAVGGATRSINITISPPVAPVVTISNLTCSPATLGQAFICTLDGANLPSTTSASSGSCSFSPLEKTSSTSNQIQFRCTPIYPGVFSIDFNIPGAVGGASRTLSIDARSSNGTTFSQVSCTQSVVGQYMTCSVSGTNLPVSTTASASGCAPANMSLISASSTLFQFVCAATASGSLVLTVVVPGAQGGSVQSFTYTGLPASAAVLVDSATCSSPAIDEVFTCILRGSNLPDSTTMTSSACGSASFDLQPGATSSQKVFSCMSSASNSSVGMNVPGISGNYPGVTFDRFLSWGPGSPGFGTSPASATNCGSPLAAGSTPATVAAGEFKVYSGNCVASLTLPESEWNSVLSSTGFFNFHRYSRRFSLVFKDSFDFVVLMLDTSDTPASYQYVGVYSSLSSRGPVRIRRQMGTMLLTFINSQRGFANPIEGGPILHELLHEWANNGVLPSPNDSGHWGFSSAGGQLGGWHGPSGVVNLDGNTWQAKGPPLTCLPGATALDLASTCTPPGKFGTFANGGNSVAYSPLELFAMGLVPAGNVGNLTVAYDGAWVNPASGIFSASDWRTYSVAQIQASMGTNAPDVASSQKHFRIATVVLTNRSVLDATTVNTLNASLEQFALDGNPQYGLVGNRYLNFHNFYSATKGLATIRTGGLLNEVR